MPIEWWHWAVAGIILIIAELAIPTFVLIWFGLGALVVAAIFAFVPGLMPTAQLSIWLFCSILLVALWFRVFKPGQFKTRAGTSDPNVIGELGLLIREVAAFQRGDVRFQKPILGAEVWPCIADETIAAGVRVKVISIEGSLLKVGRT